MGTVEAVVNTKLQQKQPVNLRLRARDFIFSDGGYTDNAGGADGYDGYYRDAYLRGDRLVDGAVCHACYRFEIGS